MPVYLGFSTFKRTEKGPFGAKTVPRCNVLILNTRHKVRTNASGGQVRPSELFSQSLISSEYGRDEQIKRMQGA